MKAAARMNERCMIVLLKVGMCFVSQLSPRLLSRVKTGVLLGPLPKIASSTLISSDQERNREDEQADAILARPVLDCSQQRRQEKSTESPSGSDQARDHADVLGKALRHELKHCPISHAEHSHAQEQKRHDDGKRGQ